VEGAIGVVAGSSVVRPRGLPATTCMTRTTGDGRPRVAALRRLGAKRPSNRRSTLLGRAPAGFVAAPCERRRGRSGRHARARAGSPHRTSKSLSRDHEDDVERTADTRLGGDRRCRLTLSKRAQGHERKHLHENVKAQPGRRTPRRSAGATSSSSQDHGGCAEPITHQTAGFETLKPRSTL
jgi:hypothetical protein